MGLRRAAILLMLAGGQAWAQPAAPPQAVPPSASADPNTGLGKHIFLPPPLEWDAAMLAVHPALQQTAADFANLTGGLAFGMSPSALGAKLAQPYSAVSWDSLSPANEFPVEARMFGVPIAAAGALWLGATACVGSNSAVVFLFRANGLSRISYRLAADKVCSDTNEAARQIYARYVRLGPSVAYSVRYLTGRTQVVDLTDSTADMMVPVRWRQSAK